MKQLDVYSARTESFDLWLFEHWSFSIDNANEQLHQLKNMEPDESEERCKIMLLSFYAIRSNMRGRDYYKTIFAKQMLWLIENDPEHPILFSPITWVVYSKVNPVFEAAWLKAVEKTDSPFVFVHASHFFLPYDTKRYLVLAQRTLLTGTRNPIVLERLELDWNHLSKDEQHAAEFAKELKTIRQLLDKATQIT